jgi:hypothetical protein
MTLCRAAAIAALLAAPAIGAQQVSNAGTGVPKTVMTVGMWMAVAHNAPLKTRLGPRNDRDLYMIGLRAAWAAPASRRLNLAYTIDLLPAVVSTGMPQYHITACDRRCLGPGQHPVLLRTAYGYELYDYVMERRTIYGIGIAPVGLEMRLSLVPRLALVASSSGGLVWFTDPIPDPGERRLNFTADARAGLELRITRQVGLAISYHFNHISNGGAGRVNPGMNSNMIEIGIVPTVFPH